MHVREYILYTSTQLELKSGYFSGLIGARRSQKKHGAAVTQYVQQPRPASYHKWDGRYNTGIASKVHVLVALCVGGSKAPLRK